MSAGLVRPGPIRLRAEGLRVRHRADGSGFELRIAELELRAGEVLGVLGPNGAGKSTLMQALAGLLQPSAGRVERLDPRPPALVFQRPLVLRGSVLRNVELALWPRVRSRQERRRRAFAALELFGLDRLARRDARTLSGGELRRLALARALACEPAVLLLDEPFDDLDAEGQESLLGDLERAVGDAGLAVALVTHELGRALGLAARIAVLWGGELVQLDRADAVLRRPADPRVARLVGMSNLLPGRVGRERRGELVAIELGAGRRLRAACSLAAGARVLAGIRPEHVKLEAAPSSDHVVGCGRVRSFRADGPLLTAAIDWQGLEVRAHLLAGRGLGRELKRDDAIWLAVRPEDVHVMPAAPGSAGER